jgi:hypothetical protein
VCCGLLHPSAPLRAGQHFLTKAGLRFSGQGGLVDGNGIITDTLTASVHHGLQGRLSMDRGEGLARPLVCQAQQALVKLNHLHMVADGHALVGVMKPRHVLRGCMHWREAKDLIGHRLKVA